MSDVTWRAATTADAAAVADLFRAIARSVPVGLETELAEVQARLSAPRLDLPLDTLIGIDPTDTVVAYAEAADMGVGQDRMRIRLTNAVHPDGGEQTTRRTHQWLLERARQLRRQRHPNLPGVLGARCAAADHARLALLTGSGFEVASWHQDLVRTADRPIPPTTTPAGVVITPYRATYDEAAWTAHNQAHADLPGALLPDAQNWAQHATGLPNFLPDASFLAITGDPAADVAAFLFSLEHHDITGIREAALHCMGTRPQWRRQGLASSLISHALTAYQRAGLGQARLQVNASNTAAVNLYRRYGFTDSGRGYAVLHASIT
jgi:ribosomal protein S18 acetylase RimI-like enzyme